MSWILVFIERCHYLWDGRRKRAIRSFLSTTLLITAYEILFFGAIVWLHFRARGIWF
jgi:hypothetical protein